MLTLDNNFQQINLSTLITYLLENVQNCDIIKGDIMDVNHFWELNSKLIEQVN